MESPVTCLQLDDADVVCILIIAFFLPYFLGSKKEIMIKMDEDQLQILDDLPSSAVELQVKDKVYKYWNLLLFLCTLFPSPLLF